jgi:hypothetical protein
MNEGNRPVAWRKSTYSNGMGNCVEVGTAASAVAVRDTTNRDGVTLIIPAAAWQALIGGLRVG